MNYYDIIIIGGGHAGVEAALAGARLGQNVLMLSLSLDNIAYMACNPALGGTAKGHLIREIDALGGQMGIAADKNLIQLRMLNTSKGAAVQSLRAQADKTAYHVYMKQVVEKQENLTVLQAEVREIKKSDEKKWCVDTNLGEQFFAGAVVVASGVYLNSDIIVGEVRERRGPAGFQTATGLSGSLEQLGYKLRRFKTGTPPRVLKSSLDLEKMEIQDGMENVYPFSFLTDISSFTSSKAACYLTYTNQKTHDIIRENLHRSPMHNGSIRSTGARYCPSVEDKIFRFPDKERHQVFVEPEGEGTDEMYVQGLSSALPAQVQRKIVNSVVGMEQAKIARYAYAIEYDCIDSTELFSTLMSKKHDGLFFAGQINGTSGYEEAAAQGLVAGINAVCWVKGQEPLLIRRDEAYIGVMLDDLTVRGTNEPYRMMTARAEYRLKLRQENADLRLTPKAVEVGLACGVRKKVFEKRLKEIEELRQIVPVEKLKKMDFTSSKLVEEQPEFAKYNIRNLQEVETEIKFAGYLARQEALIKEQARLSEMKLPAEFDYMSVTGLRIEAGQKLTAAQPENLSQAGRISGVNPADLTVLMVFFGRKR
jgi:tRNA uridine 5-carboxymethylaminomethyl modification enzyme